MEFGLSQIFLSRITFCRVIFLRQKFAYVLFLSRIYILPKFIQIDSALRVWKGNRHTDRPSNFRRKDFTLRQARFCTVNVFTSTSQDMKDSWSLFSALYPLIVSCFSVRIIRSMDARLLLVGAIGLWFRWSVCAINRFAIYIICMYNTINDIVNIFFRFNDENILSITTELRR